MQLTKAKRDPGLVAEKAPQLARAELLDKGTRGRFEAEIDAALKRRQTNEAKLGGALRAVAAMSPALRATMADAARTMIKRRTLSRELYSATMRSLAELDDRQSLPLVKTALAMEDAGGSATLSAASFSRDPSLRDLLAKTAASRQSHLAFGAEIARVARGESNGAHLTALAPMIKESHRIAMCVELFIPLVRGKPIPACVGPALTTLRAAERHLGRWLVLAEIAVNAGDLSPLEEARTKSESGPISSRAAWSLVTWALSQADARTRGKPEVLPPQTRPTLELIARLSDRPSADRDTTFLFRMAHARSQSAKAMLEATVRQLPIADENGVRAALYLARDHGRDDLQKELAECATTAKREELRGLAAAALWDAGGRERAREIADDLVASKVVGNVAWGARIRAAAKTTNGNGAEMAGEPIVGETAFRWVQWGWLE
jgi:hypothetical protein